MIATRICGIPFFFWCSHGTILLFSGFPYVSSMYRGPDVGPYQRSIVTWNVDSKGPGPGYEELRKPALRPSEGDIIGLLGRPNVPRISALRVFAG